MTVPKMYDRETYEYCEVEFHDSTNLEHKEKMIWNEKLGDPFSNESLVQLQKVAKAFGYNQFEIIKKANTVHRYAAEDKNEK